MKTHPSRNRKRFVAATPLWPLTLAGLLAILVPSAVDAQNLPLKLPPAASTRITTCPVDIAEAAAPVVAPAVIDSLVDAGVMAGLRGDHEEARLLFRQVTFLDPSNPIVPYRLAVTLEALGDMEGAVAEYCRYVALNPLADDVTNAERRVQLLSERANAEEAAWRELANSGVTAYRAGLFGAAADVFDDLVGVNEREPLAWYNRGVSRIAAGDVEAGMADLDRYLALAPDAADRIFVRTYLDNLAMSRRAEESVAMAVGADTMMVTGAIAADPPVDTPITSAAAPDVRLPPAPGSVLLRGLLIPGLGQLTTGRPAFGILVLGATAGAAAYGLLEEVALEPRIFTDPFGNRYEDEVEVVTRPNQTLGLAVAGGVALIGALEGYFHARGEWARFSVARGGAGTIGLAVTVPGR